MYWFQKKIKKMKGKDLNCSPKTIAIKSDSVGAALSF
jgi:hypothetical protein